MKKCSQKNILFFNGLLLFFLITTSASAYSNGTLVSSVKLGATTTNGATDLVNNYVYGYSVEGIGDLNNDGIPDISVGATGYPGGARYIHFMNSDGSIKSTVKIANGTMTNAPVTASGDNYGYNIANIGDLNNDGIEDTAIGSYGNDMGGSTNTNRGAFFIEYMNRDGSILSSVKIGQGTTNGPTLALNDNYATVANIGDLDNDGINDIAVGAINDDTGGASSNRGAFYIHYMNRNGSIKSTVKISSATTNGPTGLLTDDHYGRGIIGLGDLDSDGIPDIAVAASGDDTNGVGRGAIYIHYMNRNGSIKSTVKIVNGTTNGPDSVSYGYGFGLANMGDLDNDGINDIAVGAYSDTTGGTARGALYIHYMNRNGSIKSTVKIAHGTTNGPTISDSTYYGMAVASVGDINGDGSTDVAVGVPYDNSAKGAVYIHFLKPTPAITLSKTSLTTTEGQVGDTFTAVLNSKPANNVTVTIGITSSEVTLSTNSLTFDATNWDSPQLVTVTAVNDTQQEATHNDTLTFSVTSSDTNYNGMSVASIPVTVIDNDEPAVTITPGTISFTESGSTTATIVLNSAPSDSVFVHASLSGGTQMALSNQTFTFTPLNWNIPQLITITPITDSIAETTQTDTIVLSTTSADPNYENLAVPSVSLSMSDDDTAGISFSPTSFSFIEGESGTLSIHLNSQPTGTVTVTLNPINSTVVLSTNTITFTPANWNTNQTVTIEAPDNATIQTSTREDTISMSSSSSDTNYNNLTDTIEIQTTDDDSAHLVLSDTSFSLTEGEQKTLSARLSTQPTDSVEIRIHRSASNQTLLSTETVTILPENWNIPQLFYVTALDDSLIEKDQIDTISFELISSDTNYSNITTTPISVTVIDNDGTIERIRPGSVAIGSVAKKTPTATKMPEKLTKSLKQGSIDGEVRLLQQFLNQRGFLVSRKGPGAPNKETNVFGPATKKALSIFQKTYKLKTINGILTPETKTIINTLNKS